MMKRSLVFVLAMFSTGICCADKVSVVNKVVGEPLHNLCFPVDDKIGYFSTNDYPSMLYKTTDSGKTWKKSPLNFGSRNVYFPKNNKIGYLIRNSDHGQSIVLTQDGGNTWTDVNSNFMEKTGGAVMLGATINKLFFFDILKGYAIGHEGLILKTLDSGKTWVQQKSGTSGSLDAISFPGDDKIGYVSGEGGIFKTSDYGEHWEQIYSKNISSIHFPKSPVIGYGTEYGQILKTIDGGKTWKEIANLDFTIHQIYFLNEKIGYVVGGITGEDDSWSIVMKTSDGGNEWGKLSVETTDDLEEITFPTDKVGFAIGSGGSVIRIVRDEKKLGENKGR